MLLANQTQQCVKRILYHDEVRFIPEIQGWLNIQNSINVMYHVHRIKDKTAKNKQTKKPEKAFDKIHDKSLIKLVKRIDLT